MKATTTILVLSVLLGVCRPTAAAPSNCSGSESHILVDLKEHVLLLCSDGKSVETFGVRLGRGGAGKTQEGDGKTPVGVYDLGDPRPSNRFGTFIPIGYPSAEQRKAGFTGGNVGVHGPGRWVKWLGRLVNTFDLSDGCVGVATDEEIERIAKWVRSTSARKIELR